MLCSTHTAEKGKNRKKETSQGGEREERLVAGKEERREGDAHRTTWMEIDLVDGGSL